MIVYEIVSFHCCLWPLELLRRAERRPLWLVEAGLALGFGRPRSLSSVLSVSLLTAQSCRATVQYGRMAWPDIRLVNNLGGIFCEGVTSLSIASSEFQPLPASSLPRPLSLS